MYQLTHETGRAFAHEDFNWLAFHYLKFCEQNGHRIPSVDELKKQCGIPVEQPAATPPRAVEWLDESAIQARFDVCKPCEHFKGQREGKTHAVDCDKCPACSKAGGIKLALKQARCPIGKWTRK